MPAQPVHTVSFHIDWGKIITENRKMTLKTVGYDQDRKLNKSVRSNGRYICARTWIDGSTECRRKC